MSSTGFNNGVQYPEGNVIGIENVTANTERMTSEVRQNGRFSLQEVRWHINAEKVSLKT